jgi:hypothetical protein
MNGDLMRDVATGIGVALLLLVMAGLLVAWERGPGSRPHDPPVDHDAVRGIARGWVIMAPITVVVWAVAGIWGLGSVFVILAVTLLATGVLTIRRRRAGS